MLWRFLIMSCEVCGSGVTSDRAKYCSSRCRQQAYRERKKQIELAKQAKWSMYDHELLYNLAGVMCTMRHDDFIGFFELARRLDGNAEAKRTLRTIAEFFGVYEND